MNINIETVDDIAVMALEGRMDGTQAGAAEKQFDELVQRGYARFVIDLSGMSYISSAGLRIVLVAVKKTKSLRGRIVFAGLSEQVTEIFEMSGFLPLLETAPARADALRALQG